MNSTDLSVHDDSTLRKAVETVEPGQTIRLAPGMYRQPVVLRRGGTPEQPVRLVAEEPGTVILSGAEEVREWRMEGGSLWSTPWDITAEERLRPHFGIIATPCQVWWQDLRLTLVRDRDSLEENSFTVENGRVWVRLDLRCDPRSGGMEISRHGTALWVEADDVEVNGLTVTRCAPSVQLAGAEFKGTGLVVRDCEFSEAAGGKGAGFEGEDLRIHGNRIHHNGQMGFSFKGINSGFEANHVYENDLRNFCGHPEAEWQVWESGGGKVAFTRNSVFRGNRFVDNRFGPGLWLDIDNYHNRIEGNYFLRNGHSAVMIEISRDNVVCNNVIEDTREYNYSAAGVLVQLSSRTRIYHNVFLGSEGFGVHLRWHVRSRDIHPYEPEDPDEFEAEHGFHQEDWMAPDGPYPVSDNDIRNNVFVDCRRGAIQLDAHPELTTGNTSDHNFFWNRYSLHPMAGGHRLLEWQEMTGLDTHSFYDKAVHYGPLFRDAGGGDLRPHPDGPLATYRVPRLKEVDLDMCESKRGAKTLPGPLEEK